MKEFQNYLIKGPPLLSVPERHHEVEAGIKKGKNQMMQTQKKKQMNQRPQENMRLVNSYIKWSLILN